MYRVEAELIFVMIKFGKSSVLILAFSSCFDEIIISKSGEKAISFVSKLINCNRFDIYGIGGLRYTFIRITLEVTI